jgi:hypothetical protein
MQACTDLFVFFTLLMFFFTSAGLQEQPRNVNAATNGDLSVLSSNGFLEESVQSRRVATLFVARSAEATLAVDGQCGGCREV